MMSVLTAVNEDVEIIEIASIAVIDNAEYVGSVPVHTR